MNRIHGLIILMTVRPDAMRLKGGMSSMYQLNYQERGAIRSDALTRESG